MVFLMCHLLRRASWPAVFLALCSVAPAAEPPARVTFCTYNLKNWLTMERRASPSARSLTTAPKPEAERKRVVEILATIQPDILGVCEIGDADDVAELQQRLKKAGVDLPYTELAHGGDEIRRLALLSKFPIKQRNSQLNLQYQIGDQTLPLQRGILHVTIALTPQLDLHLLGVHLKSKRLVPEAEEAEMRRNEARLLRRHIDQLFVREPDAAILAYGDFNEHRHEAAIADIMGSPRNGETAMLDIPLRDANGEVWTHFWDEADIYSRLDYCFVSRLLRPHIDLRASHIHGVRDFDKASDHRPLVLKISHEPILKK